MRYLVIILVLFCISSCTKDDNPQNGTEPSIISYDFNTFSAFIDRLNEMTSIEDPLEREEEIVIFLDTMKTLGKLPFVKDDSVAFIYYGDATSVKWPGDFNLWDHTTVGWQGTNLNNSDLFLLEKTFPIDARLDYKIVVGTNWILDPLNNHIQYSGFGPNSELRMPQWIFPEETELWEGVERGTISDNIRITSQSLGYDLQYRVYLPFNYNVLDNLPIIYVTDGHEYLADDFGAMRIVLDNLIYEGTIEPIIAVFIDPRDPDNLGSNLRGDQYTANPLFASFVASELVPEIDQNYKTNPIADKRAILGTSLGGWNSAYFGIEIPETFHLIGIHSPAFDYNLINLYENSSDLPHKFYLSTGTIYDTEDNALALKAIFDGKGYTYQYTAVNQGHSWGNWRGLIDEPLIMFFPASN